MRQIEAKKDIKSLHSRRTNEKLQNFDKIAIFENYSKNIFSYILTNLNWDWSNDSKICKIINFKIKI